MTTFRAHSDSRILKPFDAQIPTFYTLGAKIHRDHSNLGSFKACCSNDDLYIVMFLPTLSVYIFQEVISYANVYRLESLLILKTIIVRERGALFHINQTMLGLGHKNNFKTSDYQT